MCQSFLLSNKPSANTSIVSNRTQVVCFIVCLEMKRYGCEVTGRKGRAWRNEKKNKQQNVCADRIFFSSPETPEIIQRLRGRRFCFSFEHIVYVCVRVVYMSEENNCFHSLLPQCVGRRRRGHMEVKVKKQLSRILKRAAIWMPGFRYGSYKVIFCWII